MEAGCGEGGSTHAGAAAAAAGSSARDVPPDVQSKINSTREKIKEFKAIPAGLREELFQHRGGFDAVIAGLEKEVAELGAEKRSGLPLREQVEGAAAHEKRLGKQHAAALTKQEELAKQVREMQDKLQAQQQAVTQLAEKHGKAKAEYCMLSASLVEAKRTEAVGQSVMPATASGFAPGSKSWTSLEKVVSFAQNPEVLAALAKAGMAKEEFDILDDELQTVRKVAATQLQALAPAPAATPPNGTPVAASTASLSTGPAAETGADADIEMDFLDEDQISALAELEVTRAAREDGLSHSLENGQSGEVRAARMDAARARIKSDFKVRKKGKTTH